jgi:hypothetical protein
MHIIIKAGVRWTRIKLRNFEVNTTPKIQFVEITGICRATKINISPPERKV